MNKKGLTPFDRIPSVLVNWRLGRFFYIILKGIHQKISKKPSDATYNF
jgi:hypothetical protein